MSLHPWFALHLVPSRAALPHAVARLAALLAAVAVSTGCEGSETGVVRPAVREVYAAPSDVLIPLPDGTLGVEREGRLVLIDPRRLDLEPMVIGSSSEVGRVHAAVPAGGAVLVLAEGGTFVLRESSWVPSPLQESLDGPIRDAQMLPPPTGRDAGDLWIATDQSLYRVVDERAERLAIDADLRGARLAAVQRPEGPALWARLPNRVLEIWRDRAGVLRSASLVLPSLPTGIGGDASGTGWLVLGGRLHSLGADRRLVDHGVDVERVLSSSTAREVWGLGRDGAHWLHADGRLHRVTDLDASPDDHLALGVDGSLYVAGSTVRRFAPRRDVRIEGPPDGSLIVSPEELVARLEGSPTVEILLDGAPVEPRSPPGILIEPASLADGAHELVFRITYDDGTLPVVDRRTFQIVSNATWTVHVQPMYEAVCSSCHGPEGPAITRLDARQDWERLSDVILTNLRDGRMPLNRTPLSRNEIAYVEAWIRNGFAE